ncbi:hypothetical protein [Agathobacter rectalis]|uniref:hypothetical protein n=1 Tax=Agathobacter rectalis TaxID=39491 RepID=UPI0012B0DFDE|nr:hypothetical protein [Agathobacter rectalis]MSD25111.1 hypothetical protein [Agathobacter rectalis]MSD44575.1 hypothetical protein [Agathobacter rectalis]
MLTNLDFHLQTGNLGYKTGLSFTNGDSWVTNGILGLLFTIWKWNDDGYITLYQDDKAVANLVYMNGKYLFFDADVEIQKLKRISETAIVK